MSHHEDNMQNMILLYYQVSEKYIIISLGFDIIDETMMLLYYKQVIVIKHVLFLIHGYIDNQSMTGGHAQKLFPEESVKHQKLR